MLVQRRWHFRFHMFPPADVREIEKALWAGIRGRLLFLEMSGLPC
jgi:hypothetical protein